MMKKNTKSYSELMSLPTFEERFEYLKCNGQVGGVTFGSKRYLNQLLYKTDKWKSKRDKIIIRDEGRDLGIPGREILEGIVNVHHINSITLDDVLNENPSVFDDENLICTSDITHKAIHYGNKDSLILVPVDRKQNDTSPWRH